MTIHHPTLSAKKLLSATLLTTLTLSLAACKTNNTAATGTTSTTTTDTAATPVDNAGTTTETATDSGAAPTGVLVVQESSDIPTLDPGTTYDTGSGQIVENLYETLVTYEGNSLSELKPLLATEWQEGEDGKEYRFTLRDGVKFHTGNPFECKDAEYTFRRNLVTNTSDSGNWFLSESLLGTGSNANDDKSITWQRITDAVQCDGETLVFKLPKADPAFLAKLAYIGQGIVDSEHAKKIGEWDGTEATWKEAVGKDLMGSPLAQDPSGTGAYKLLDKTATAVTATAFMDYWGEKPKIKNVILQKIPEQAARLQAFEKGDADIVETGGRTIVEAQLAGKPGIAILDDLPNTSAFGISMNQKISGKSAIGSGKLDGQGIPANFFSDVDVRRGFVAAFNTPQYIQDVQKGKGEPLNFLLPLSFPGYDESIEPPKYDLDAAKEYFQNAWDGQVWDKGFTVNVSYRAGSATAQTGMEILKKNIESINPKFHVNIVAKEWSEIIKGSNQGTEAMVMTGWAPDYADPDNFVHTFYSSDGYYNPRINAKDEQIDAWINEARSTTDTEKRNELYSKIAKRAIDQAWYIYMPNQPGVLAYRDNLQGVSLDTYNPMLGFSNFGTGTLWKDLSKS
ncbi:ABC transporter substrate-binding protein [Deinococcus humi]|uniref:Peptide/nickel transport system substrate-binding protein n=1 Tax=Deinococcus humi TaxID=662880 RepID=A0A7W8JY73_9DEIO|nr:ABC transporter substrate-binding protein [Deinococcus humi]MBB5365003.1 peptide/nickel transport system substrate-binding protein [Deinococcus humi]GGO34877.1 peptide ABC transporter substrate-binding protein [Deinococcus humi]